MSSDRDYTAMSQSALEQLREVLLDRIAAVPAFRRGSLQVGYRKCGRATCRCARALSVKVQWDSRWVRLCGG